MADIVVIDDDPLIRETIDMVLSSAGHRVRLADSGVNGLLSVLHQKPDLILLDMNLPGMDGYTLAKEFSNASKYRGVPILAVTAHDSAEDYDAAYAAGCTGFLAKPLDQARLLHAVDEQLKRK
ncbi:MAG TPA: response regulator [Magnetospirillaceae bacterium]|jgi:CheY-like chemotaxis protein